MRHGDPTRRQYARDQETAVADRRILFAAQDRNTESPDAIEQEINAFTKKLRLCNTAIEHMPAGVVKMTPLRPAAQFTAEKIVCDPVATEQFLKRSGIKLRRKFRFWIRSRVYNRFDSMIPQETKENVHGMVRMANGEQMVLHPGLGPSYHAHH